MVGKAGRPAMSDRYTYTHTHIPETLIRQLEIVQSFGLGCWSANLYEKIKQGVRDPIKLRILGFEVDEVGISSVGFDLASRAFCI